MDDVRDAQRQLASVLSGASLYRLLDDPSISAEGHAILRAELERRQERRDSRAETYEPND